MPDPFKNVFNTTLIKTMATHLKTQWAQFDDQSFINDANKNLQNLELKERSSQITKALITHLPDDFQTSGKILLASLGATLTDGETLILESDKEGISGWGMMPLTHYVAKKGLGDVDFSLRLLKEMTKRFSAEFDIRFFLIDHEAETLRALKTWSQDANPHVRRLVSEGTRPRLPWAMQFPKYIQDPSPILPLLESLKDDESEYVRRSVANNLNDIAKDHPDLVADIAKTWLKGASLERKKLVRHACRTLLKQGHPGVLGAFGFAPAKLEKVMSEILTPTVEFGKALIFSLSFQSASKNSQSLMIDFNIHHLKANGKTTAKTFKWKNITLAPNAVVRAEKKHPFKKISTRVFYPGVHQLELLINGESMGISDFELLMS